MDDTALRPQAKQLVSDSFLKKKKKKSMNQLENYQQFLRANQKAAEEHGKSPETPETGGRGVYVGAELSSFA